VKALRACIGIELLKFRRSKTGWITLAVFLVFSIFIRGGDFEDIPVFLYLVGHYSFSIIATWIFGREFVNRTATDLLVLPLARSTVVLSKIVVLIIITVTLSVFHFAVSCTILLFESGFEGWSQIPYCAVKQGIMAVILLALCMPVFFLSLCSRGYFLPIAVFLVLFFWVNIDNGRLPFARYVPWRISLIYLNSGILRPLDVLSLLVTGLGGTLASLAWWRYADHT
jgi:ABC-2 type transport system permease protein